APPYIYTLSLHDALPIFVVSNHIRLIFKIRKTSNIVVTSLIEHVRFHNGSWGNQLDDFSFNDTFGNLWVFHLLTDGRPKGCQRRSEEHTSELQSRFDLVC